MKHTIKWRQERPQAAFTEIVSFLMDQSNSTYFYFLEELSVPTP